MTSKLGEGGTGAVYRTTDTKLNREVAIKVLPKSFAGDGRLRRDEELNCVVWLIRVLQNLTDTTDDLRAPHHEFRRSVL
jgi:serine/threonine protein kinase